VICTTDHGIAFPGMKCNLTDHGIGVMLIMRGPMGFAGGRVCDAMISQLDLFPTICELGGIEPPSWLQGRSMMPLIREEVEEINEEVFAEVTYHAAYEPQRAVRTKRWKYIRRFDPRPGPVLCNCDDSASKDLLVEYGWANLAPDVEQLYDLVFDPAECNNLSRDPSAKETLQDMRGRLDRWMRDTYDPLMLGPVPAPSGASVNDPDDVSPSQPTRTIMENESV
jgi:N-sulfoglucosamine sulfohydrolase